MQIEKQNNQNLLLARRGTYIYLNYVLQQKVTNYCTLCNCNCAECSREIVFPIVDLFRLLHNANSPLRITKAKSNSGKNDNIVQTFLKSMKNNKKTLDLRGIYFLHKNENRLHAT